MEDNYSPPAVGPSSLQATHWYQCMAWGLGTPDLWNNEGKAPGKVKSSAHVNCCDCALSLDQTGSTSRPGQGPSYLSAPWPSIHIINVERVSAWSCRFWKNQSLPQRPHGEKCCPCAILSFLGVLRDLNDGDRASEEGELVMVSLTGHVAILTPPSFHCPGSSRSVPKSP